MATPKRCNVVTSQTPVVSMTTRLICSLCTMAKNRKIAIHIDTFCNSNLDGDTLLFVGLGYTSWNFSDR